MTSQCHCISCIYKNKEKSKEREIKDKRKPATNLRSIPVNFSGYCTMCFMLICKVQLRLLELLIKERKLLQALELDLIEKHFTLVQVHN